MASDILSNLWQVGGPGFTAPEDAAVYLVRFGDRAALSTLHFSPIRMPTGFH